MVAAKRDRFPTQSELRMGESAPEVMSSPSQEEFKHYLSSGLCRGDLSSRWLAGGSELPDALDGGASVIVVTCVRHPPHWPGHSLMLTLPSTWFTLGKPCQVSGKCCSVLCGV